MPKKEWGGFHVIEQALWVDGSTSGLDPEVTEKLNEDVELLANLVKDVELQPAGIANGSVELLNEVSSSKITGEEERYSRTDLVDFEANVQGSQAAYEAVKPLLAAKNAALADADRHALRRGDGRTRAVSERHQLRALHESHLGRHEGAVAGDRRAGRAALEGREADREHMSRADAVSRRRFLGVAGAAGAGALVATATTLGTDVLAASPAAASVLEGLVPFHGAHQAGIITPAQDKLLMASFDVTTSDKNDIVDMLREWTRAARRMTAGRPVGDDNTDPDAPPDDTGESEGLNAASLTVTFGFGATLFERDGVDRFGLQSQRPEALVDLPRFAGDEIEPARSGGDLVVQACANDPQVAFHAIRNLTRIGRGNVVLRWSQSGFGRTSSTDSTQTTPRNLMGFKDGTNNLVAEDDAALRAHTWVGNHDNPIWMRGGSYMVVRRIRMLLEVWDRSTLADQEATIGRVKGSGAPIGKNREHDVVDLAARQDGELVIAQDAHIRLAAPAGERRCAAPAPRVLLHRRHQPRHQPARRRLVLHRVPT